MKISIFSIYLAILSIFFLQLFCGGMINSVGAKNSQLRVLATNDLHGNLNNIAGLLGASKSMDIFERSPNVDTLKISAGDNWAGGDVEKNKLTGSFLSHMGIEMSAVGNHEFDAGVIAFAEKIDKTGIKFIATNMDIAPNNPLYGKIQKSVIKEISGTKYGIVGATTPDLLSVISNKDDIAGITVYGDKQTKAALQQEIIKLMQQGVERIILTSHCGLEMDKDIAQNVAGIDLIVSGHSHDEVNGIVPGKNYFKSPSGEPVLIVQGGENANNYNLVDIVFDENGSISKATNDMKMIKPVQNSIVEYIKDVKMGASPELGNISQIEPLKGNRRIEPHGWANLICDSMRKELNVDIALMNAANMRKVPVAGRLTERDIIETVPMKNKLLTTSMTEAELVNAIKNASVSLIKADGYPGLIQTSGLRYKIDTQGNLVSMSFVDKVGNVIPVDIQNPSKDKVYTVAYDSFMADGREYPEFVLNGKPSTQLNYDKDKTLIDYINKMSQQERDNLKIIDDGRIEIVQTSAPQPPSNNTQNFLGLTLPKTA